jgi:hypothetical protein
VALAGIATAVGLAIVASHAVGAANYHACDNMLGECLRFRQQYALRAIGAAGALAAAACLWGAAWALVRRFAVWQVIAIGAALALLVLLVTVHPVEHLDNRWDGWLSDGS